MECHTIEICGVFLLDPFQNKPEDKFMKFLSFSH